MAAQETGNLVEGAARRASGMAEKAAGALSNTNGRSKRLAKALGWVGVGLGAAELIAPGTVSKMIGGRKNNTLVRAMGARELGTGLALLTLPYTMPFLWARVGGDALDLSLLGEALTSPITKKGRLIATIAAVGGIAALDVIASRRHTWGSNS